MPTQNPRLYIITHRDQLWAEAKAAHEAGETWWLEHDDKDARRELEARQESARFRMPGEEYVFPAMAALGFPDINLPLNRLTEEIGKLCKNAQVRPPPRSALGLSCVKRVSSRTENGQVWRLWYCEDRPCFNAWKREELGARTGRDGEMALKRFEELLNPKRAARIYDSERDLSSIYEEVAKCRAENAANR